MKNLKAVIFDADGVVIKTEEMFSCIYQRKFDVNPDLMMPFFKGEFQDCLIDKADLKEKLKPYLKTWKWNDGVESFLKYWFDSENMPDLKLLELIQDLRKKGIMCYLATNQEKYRVEYLSKEMRFNELFDGIYSSASLGVKKPNILFYEKMYKDIEQSGNFMKSEIMIWDDTPMNVDAAKVFGFDSYFYSNLEHFSSIVR